MSHEKASLITSSGFAMAPPIRSSSHQYYKVTSSILPSYADSAALSVQVVYIIVAVDAVQLTQAGCYPDILVLGEIADGEYIGGCALAKSRG